MYKIDKRDGKVFVTDNAGKEVVVPFTDYVKAEWVVSEFTNVHLCGDKVMKIKKWKEAGDHLGCSASKFAKMLRGALYLTYVIPYKKYVQRWAMQAFNKTIHGKKLKLIIDSQALLAEYAADGNEHLQGLGLLLGSTQTAKKTCGKHLWNSLCRNSRSRNDLLFNITYGIYDAWKNDCDEQFIPTLLSELNKLPSTILCADDRNFPILVEDAAIIINLWGIVRKEYPSTTYKDILKGDLIQRLIHVIRDTKAMAYNIHLDINYEWSVSRWQKEHDRIKKLVMQMKYPTDPFPVMENIPKEAKIGNYTAELLDSPRKLYEEGQAMHHCVAGLSYTVREGMCAIFSIKGEGKASTVCYPHPKSNVRYQHYGVCNTPVTVEEKAVADELSRRIAVALRSIRIEEDEDTYEVKEEDDALDLWNDRYINVAPLPVPQPPMPFG